MTGNLMQFTRPILKLIGLCASISIFVIFLTRETSHRFNPTSEVIAYTSYDQNRQTSWINLLNLESGLELTLSSRRDTEYMPKWTPDGNSLLFISNRNGIFDLFSMDFSFGAIPQVKQITSNQRVTSASISPSGDQIAFTAVNNGQVDLYIMQADGSDIIQLRNDTHPDSDPVISPNGEEIVYRSLRNSKAELYRIGTNGQRYYVFSFFPLDRYSPTWSPDGEHLAFTTIESIYISEIGTDISTPVVNSVASLYVDWLPTGDELLFFSYERDQVTSFYLIDTDGSNIRKIHTFKGIATDPDWRP